MSSSQQEQPRTGPDASVATPAVPTVGYSTERPGYAPGEPSRPPEYSEWDPRSAPGTYLLLGINIGVFLWMLLHGVSITDPSLEQLRHFGANDAALVVNDGQWFRLLTAIFLHIGIWHIATNMWCLWNLGLLGEPLLGPFGLVAVYVLTGVAGNLLSVGWDVVVTHEAGVGAGASGAVFGIAGILIVLQRLRTSVVRFAAINLVIGASTIAIHGIPRIDNSAHVGGFLCGLALGPGLVPRMTAGRTGYLARQKIVFLCAALVLSLFGYWIANLGG
jgi:rhomboid protease GluP